MSLTETEPRRGTQPPTAHQLAELLAEARERTLQLVEGLDEADLDRVHDPLMSPLAWDLGHIAAFEDLWVCRSASLEPLRPDLAVVYDAAETPRSDRGGAAYLRARAVRAYLGQVRERALDVLAEVELDDPGDRLNHGGCIWLMLVQHEQQHNETMLQTLKLAAAGTYAPDRRTLPPAAPRLEPADAMVAIPAGPCAIGAPAAAPGFRYDNERPAHELELSAFEIDLLPVTNARFAEFAADGGYRARELWSERGWAWRLETGAEHPLYWTDDGGERSFERVEPIAPDAPVMHVSWFEADAFARWCGRRLPTEAEWERAAAWDPARGEARSYPWGEAEPDPGRANLDQLAFGPAPAGAYPDGAAATGALGMLGDAWEWTASEFCGYPGFEAFPYRAYSEAFFGCGYRVLRGGSWATRPGAIRNSFRNWDHPERRQIHAGFRCARDL